MHLFEPIKIGNQVLKNRIVMAPMTRSRARAGNVPSELAPLYYAQRASGGLLITEASQVSPQGVGYIATPGIHTPEQVAGWHAVTKAVHARGGKIFIQLWHVGRVSHPDFHGGALPVAPSAIGFDGEAYTHNGRVKTVTPRALATAEIAGIVEDFRRATHNARAAGFDGVEIHGANGYLVDQFLQSGTNQRSDQYGGTAQNRARFLLEVTRGAIEAWDAGHVGVRLSPLSTLHGMSDADPDATFGYAIRELSKLKIAYLHLVGDQEGRFARHFDGVVIANGGLTRDKADDVLAKGHAQLFSFGTPYLANPDLPERLRLGAALNEPDRATFYGGGAAGYVDYPELKSAVGGCL